MTSQHVVIYPPYRENHVMCIESAFEIRTYSVKMLESERKYTEMSTYRDSICISFKYREAAGLSRSRQPDIQLVGGEA